MPETILIVDDEDSVRQTFEEWLAHCPDVVVRAAADAASALKIASQTPIDLAILDWNLGSGQNGLELLEDLHVFQPEVTAMLVTGYAHQATPLQALRMGVRDYLEKGAQLTRTTFLAAVERLLAGLRPRKRERAVQEGLARFRQTLSEMLPHVQTAAHWKNWPSMQAAAAALLGFLKEQCGAVDALLWIRVEVSAGSGAVPSDRWWNAAGEPLDPPSLDFSRTVAAATLALPRPGRVAETATLAAAGLELSPKEAAHRHVLACPLDLPADSAGIIELFDPADHGA
ncbi:MAG TPA: response regulator, partial [Gemmatales bacterium]|nr:response regulator [Gemmatales bacterium]